jgi:hypothetical protein
LPPCANVVPRPTVRSQSDRGLALSHAVVASDLNPRYLDAWPLARRAWREIAKLDPRLILVADPADVPAALSADPAVRVFEPVPGLHTAYQAQCIRLLFPALLAEADGVVVSDVDMIPLTASYFRRPLSRIKADHFVAYRDFVLHLREIPICYNAALPATWGTIFGVHELGDVRARLSEWAEGVRYAGTHDGEGWTTDQLVLYRTLVERGRRCRDVWILDDYYTRFRRLERTYVRKWGRLAPAALEGLRRREFADFHLLAADSDLAHLNEQVIELAIEAQRGSAE